MCKQIDNLIDRIGIDIDSRLLMWSNHLFHMMKYVTNVLVFMPPGRVRCCTPHRSFCYVLNQKNSLHIQRQKHRRHFREHDGILANSISASLKFSDVRRQEKCRDVFSRRVMPTLVVVVVSKHTYRSWYPALNR